MSLFEKLREILPTDRLRAAEPLCRHTTLRTGGPADFFAEPLDCAELAGLFGLCRRERLPFLLIGNGSNLLVSDAGFRGLVISLRRGFDYIAQEETALRAGAGALLPAVSQAALKAGLAGLEFASGIPGSVGGAAAMNAGAYGGEVGGVIREVTALDSAGNTVTLTADEMNFGYRSSCIFERNLTVTEAVFALQPGDAAGIQARMDDLAFRRREKQPLEYPSAGSTFRRPPGHFAGRLIEEAGLKGRRIGGAEVSEKHAGFIINRDRASSADIFALCRLVQAEVFKSSGVRLEPEIRLVGDFDPL